MQTNVHTNTYKKVNFGQSNNLWHIFIFVPSLCIKKHSCEDTLEEQTGLTYHQVTKKNVYSTDLISLPIAVLSSPSLSFPYQANSVKRSAGLSGGTGGRREIVPSTESTGSPHKVILHSLRSICVAFSILKRDPWRYNRGRGLMR